MKHNSHENYVFSANELRTQIVGYNEDNVWLLLPRRRGKEGNENG